ncbi:putative MFS family arabinose efflux permease [Paraburkholderia sp. UCT70]
MILNDAPSHGFASWATGARLTAFALLGGAFVQLQRRRAHPMVDLALFRQPRFVAAVLAMFGYAACAQVMMTFLPLYLQNTFGLSAVAAGIGMLPFALAMVVGPYVGAALGRWISPMLLLIALGNLLTALAAGGARYAWVAGGMIVTGLGAGVLNGDTQKAIMACVPPERTGMASGISTTTRSTAIVTSVGVLGAVLAAHARAAFDAATPLTPAVRAALDAGFMSCVMVGDAAQATASLAPALRAALTTAALASFVAGFAAALGVAALVAASVAAVVWKLAGRAEVVRFKGAVSEG